MMRIMTYQADSVIAEAEVRSESNSGTYES